MLEHAVERRHGQRRAIIKLMAGYEKSKTPLAVDEEWKKAWNNVIPAITIFVRPSITRVARMDATIDIFDNK